MSQEESEMCKQTRAEVRNWVQSRPGWWVSGTQSESRKRRCLLAHHCFHTENVKWASSSSTCFKQVTISKKSPTSYQSSSIQLEELPFLGGSVCLGKGPGQNKKKKFLFPVKSQQVSFLNYIFNKWVRFKSRHFTIRTKDSPTFLFGVSAMDSFSLRLINYLAHWMISNTWIRG